MHTFDAEDKLHEVQIDADHNYNKDSREAVYAWFGKWFLGEDDATKFKEVPFEVERDEALLVFHHRVLPEHALDAEGLTRSRIESAEEQLAARKPTNAGDLDQFREEMGSALRRSLALSVLHSTRPNSVEGNDFTAQPFVIGGNNQLPSLFLTPKTGTENGSTTLIVHPQGAMNLINPETGQPTGLVSDLLAAGESIIGCRSVSDWRAHGLPQDGKVIRDTSDRYFTTYNRTDAALRVQDILTALAYLKSQAGVSTLNLIGLGEAGLWCLLAAGFADVDRTVIDANQFDSDNDAAYLQNLPVPSIRRVGDFRTAGTLIAPHHLFIHNTGNAFQTDWIAEVYQAVDAADRLRVEAEAVSEADIAAWLVT